MAVAVCEENSITTLYKYNNFDPNNWIDVTAWLIWWNHPEWTSLNLHAIDDAFNVLIGSTQNQGSQEKARTIGNNISSSSALNDGAVGKKNVRDYPTIRNLEKCFEFETK